VQGYRVPGRRRPILSNSGPSRIVVISSGVEPDARGIHHWGGLDTFDPYVLH
jgi:hypothetical protein